MINWEKIIDSHVINALRKIGLKWWGIDVQFYDKFGNCKNSGFPVNNQCCRFIKTTKMGEKLCLQNYRKHLRSAHNQKGPFLYKCSSGLYGMIAPMFILDKYIGAIICSGLKIPSSNNTLSTIEAKTLIKHGVDKKEFSNIYHMLGKVDDRGMAYMFDFIEFVAKDIVAFYELLVEKEEVLKEQSAFMEKKYVGKYKGIVGTSTAIKKVFDMLSLIEDIESSILIDGESGTGKELVAATIHYNSPRKDKMFVVQNCSAFSETLLNSELFGHEKGAFTGAVSSRKGLFEIANGGTLFLDEIGDMQINAQSRLLRVLQDGTFYSVGSDKLKKVDVRILAATNKDLGEQVKQGKFRQDLFYRINTIHITMPPLRERGRDIYLLCDYFLSSYAEASGAEKKEISNEAMEQLMAYTWPGNIRELKNVTERLIILSGKEKVIEPIHLPREIANSTQSIFPAIHYSNNREKKLKEVLVSFEKMIIKEKLEMTNWNKKATAQLLGISRASLINKIRQYSIAADS
ncbi:MAG: sigma 54-interacting transcriptional regulator [Candidatus Brocadiaceae bacterium]|nr:sigma 54-interacting transcriptional regulator [Candidatus Brocadiaceae bacterium]